MINNLSVCAVHDIRVVLEEKGKVNWTYYWIIIIIPLRLTGLKWIVVNVLLYNLLKTLSTSKKEKFPPLKLLLYCEQSLTLMYWMVDICWSDLTLITADICFPAAKPNHQRGLWTLGTMATLQQWWWCGWCELLFVSLQVMWQPCPSMWRQKLWGPHHWSLQLLEVGRETDWLIFTLMMIMK